MLITEIWRIKNNGYIRSMKRILSFLILTIGMMVVSNVTYAADYGEYSAKYGIENMIVSDFDYTATVTVVNQSFAERTSLKVETGGTAIKNPKGTVTKQHTEWTNEQINKDFNH